MCAYIVAFVVFFNLFSLWDEQDFVLHALAVGALEFAQSLLQHLLLGNKNLVLPDLEFN